MSLFDKLKDTKLKSLKFSSDKPGGGTSLEPVIQKPILDNNLVGQERSFNDVAEENRARIAKILKSTPRGTRFVRNQIGLQISNTHLETSNAPVLNTIELGGGFIGAINKGINFINGVNKKFNSTGLSQATRVTPLHFYSSEVTLAQLESIQGSHLDRFGLTPFIEDRYKYDNIVKANNTTEDNRLTKLRTKLNVGYNPDTTNPIPKKLNSQIRGILSSVSSITNLAASISNLFGGSPFLNKLNNTVNNVTKVVSPFLVPQLDQYTGGPDSRFGIGVTSIRRWDYTNKLEDFEKLRVASNIKAGNARIDKDKYSGLEKTATTEFQIANPEEGTNIDNTNILFYSPNSSIAIKFKDLNVQKKKKHLSYGGGTANINESGNTTYQYNIIAKSPANVTLDKNSPIFKYFGKDENGEYKQTINQFERNDGEVMSVLFQLINPFNGNNLHRIIFPAYISGFKVSSDATWNEVSYIGRAENFYTFNKYKRTASFSLQIPCFNLVELREKHRALGALESSLAGRYGDDGKGTKLGGILTRLFLGNYLKGEIGIINSLSYDIPNDSSWDIDEKLAHNINVSVSFTIIHNDLTTYNEDGGFFARNIPNVAGGFISSRKAIADTGVNMEGIKDTYGTNGISKITKNPNTLINDTAGGSEFSLLDPNAFLLNNIYTFAAPLKQSIFSTLPESVMSPIKNLGNKLTPTLFSK
jgi:hypothetical protein